jgi:membrane protein YqaA with SNARE-associated domain
MPVVDYLAVFTSAFLAATILPVASELVLAGMSSLEGANIVALLVVASIGNTLGSVVNWVIGRCFLRFRDRRWFPVRPETLERASDWFGRYGVWMLLFAWVPIIGDPLTLVAGVMRVNFPVFVLLVAIGKTARYAFVLGVVELAL